MLLSIPTMSLGGLQAPSRSARVDAVEQTSGRIVEIAPDGRKSTNTSGLGDSHDLAIDAKEFLYVADTGANRVARVSPSGIVTTHIAGLGRGCKVEPHVGLDVVLRHALVTYYCL